MKKVECRFWKKLERHPLSAEYEDVNGPIFDEWVATVKSIGVLDRRIILLDGQVLDGWQMLRACIEADVKPEFVELPKNVSPDDLVKVKNDLRRPATVLQVMARLKARRERIAKARAAGESLRAIAEKEKVSKATVDRDLAETESLSPPGTVLPPDGKVTGKDGRRQPATRPKSVEEPKKQKTGKPKFDEKRFEKPFGELCRVIDDRGDLMGNKGSAFKRVHDSLSSLLDNYKLWKKETA